MVAASFTEPTGSEPDSGSSHQSRLVRPLFPLRPMACSQVVTQLTSTPPGRCAMRSRRDKGYIEDRLGSSPRPGDRHAGAVSARSPGLRKQVGETIRLCRGCGRAVVRPSPGRKDRASGLPRRPNLLPVNFPSRATRQDHVRQLGDGHERPTSPSMAGSGRRLRGARCHRHHCWRDALRRPSPPGR